VEESIERKGWSNDLPFLGGYAIGLVPFFFQWAIENRIIGTVIVTSHQ